MRCEEFRLARVSDDPAEQLSAGRHAAECAECAGWLAADRELSQAVDSWKASSPEPPARLANRIQAELAREALGRAEPTVAPRRPERVSHTWRLVAAAAALTAALAGSVWLLRTPGSAGVEGAVERLEAIEVAHAQAIADLEREAREVLDRAGDPGMPPREAALLLGYRNRLNHLDSVINEVQGFLEEHPGHAGGRTVLLAAYVEKTEVLEELLERRDGGNPS